MLVFRADGNERIGAGHIMRCLSWAENTEEESVFVVADEKFITLIEEKGFKAICLNTNYENMESELSIISVTIEDLDVSCFYVDSYYVTKIYLNELKRICNRKNAKLVYVDDRAEFAYPCDILLNYNIFAPDWRKKYCELYDDVGVPEMWLGMEYLPLRKEFLNVPMRTIKNDITDIFVSTGGADPYHIALKMIENVISNEELIKDIVFHFVLGSMNLDKSKIYKLSKKNKNISLHENVKHMRELMCECDLAISAAGSTLYELNACHIRTITYTFADNQKPIAEAFDKKRIMHYLGDYRTDNIIEKAISYVMRLRG